MATSGETLPGFEQTSNLSTAGTETESLLAAKKTLWDPLLSKDWDQEAPYSHQCLTRIKR